MSKKKIVIFDLDGVLINSKQNMIETLKKTNKFCNIDIKFKEYEKFVGLPFKDILIKVGIKKDFAKIQEIYKKFSLKNILKVRIKTNVIKKIKILKQKYDLAIFTSKDKMRTLKVLGKDKYHFKFIVTPEDIKKGKPNPEGLKKIKVKGNYKIKDMYYVGDTNFDYLAAKKINMKYLHLRSNFDNKKIKFKKKHIFKSFIKLSNYLENI
jgi:HAD superfamily hydrolase (TIGR01549 family)